MSHRFLLPGALLGAALVLGTGPRARAQRVLLREDPATDSVQTRYGPNRAFFRHLYLGYTPVVGPAAGPGAALHYLKSGELFVGVRHKYRLGRSLAAGFDVRYARLSYYLVQNDRKVLPASTQHHAESLNLSQVQLEPFVRLNFGRRGNVVGHYLDLSGWGSYALGATHRYEDRPGTGGGKRTLVVERGVNYLRRWPYGVGVRLGADRYAATVRYRLSSTFTGAANPAYPELPRWLVGLELGFF